VIKTQNTYIATNDPMNTCVGLLAAQV
jgi:hypothetical protein